MKRHFFKKFWSMALGFALLMTAAVPFTAFAQEAKPAQTPGSVVLEGVFNGIGVFEFVGNSIRYHHIAFQVPVDLTVNGQKWPITGLQYYPSSGGPAPDPFFTLDFTPDFRSYAVTEHDQVHTATLTAEDDRMELFVNQTSGDPTTGKIRLEPKEPKRQTAQAPADDPNRTTVTIEVLGGEEGFFVFRENRIVFLSDNRDERFLPQVTVNGERWRDLDVSFPLDYVPVPGSEVIREEPCPNGNASHATVNDRLKLYFNNSSAPFRNTTPARFVVSLEKQPLPEKPDDKYVVTVRAKMAGHIAGFKFEGSRIVYYPILGEYPTGVTVNGKEWKDLEKPFELGFAINPAASEILEKSAGPLTPSRYPDSFVVRLGGRLWTGNSRFVARLNDDPAVDSPVATGERERVTLDLKLQGNVRLRFRGNKLYYTLFTGVQPSITVNGKRWEDLNTPFELDFAPDPASLALLDQRGPAVELTPGEIGRAHV